MHNSWLLTSAFYGSNRSVGTSLILEILFYSHLLEYYTTLVACTGAKWQQYSQVTVMIGYFELVRLTQSGPQIFEDQNLQLPISNSLH
jgi:hypothetical protein